MLTTPLGHDVNISSKDVPTFVNDFSSIIDAAQRKAQREVAEREAEKAARSVQDADAQIRNREAVLKKEVEELEGQLTTEKKNVLAAKGELEQAKRTWQADRKELEHEKLSLEVENESLEEQKESLEEENTSLTEKVASLTVTNDSLQNSVLTLWKPQNGWLSERWSGRHVVIANHVTRTVWDSARDTPTIYTWQTLPGNENQDFELEWDSNWWLIKHHGKYLHVLDNRGLIGFPSTKSTSGSQHWHIMMYPDGRVTFQDRVNCMLIRLGDAQELKNGGSLVLHDGNGIERHLWNLQMIG